MNIALRRLILSSAGLALVACVQVPGGERPDDSERTPQADEVPSSQHSPLDPPAGNAGSGSHAQPNDMGGASGSNGAGHNGQQNMDSGAPRPLGAKVLFSMQGVQ